MECTDAIRALEAMHGSTSLFVLHCAPLCVAVGYSTNDCGAGVLQRSSVVSGNRRPPFGLSAPQKIGENESDVKSNFIWIPSSSLANAIPNINPQIRVMCMNPLARTVCTSCSV